MQTCYLWILEHSEEKKQGQMTLFTGEKLKNIYKENILNEEKVQTKQKNRTLEF